MHRDLDATDPAHDFIHHIHRKPRGSVRVFIVRAHRRIDKETKMRIVNLRDVGACIGQSDGGLASERAFNAEEQRSASGEGLRRHRRSAVIQMWWQK